MKKKILLALLIVFVGIQFVRPERNVSSCDGTDFLELYEANEEVSNLVKNACYDCHSCQPNYPWYSNIAPVSWWLQDHIDHGSEELNFSYWDSENKEKSLHKVEECIEEVKGENMPLKSYTIMHSEARLTLEQREVLVDFFGGVYDQIKED